MQRVRRPRQKGKGNKTTEIYLLPIISYVLMASMGVLCVFAALGIVRGFLRIKGFEVEGTDRFAGSEIATFAGLKRGDLLYDLDEAAAKENILDNCAYVESVKFRRKLSGKLCFVIKEREPVWYIKISGDCYVLDKELRVLEETKKEAELIDNGVVTLTMPNVKEAMVGELLVYGSGKEEIENTQKIIKSLSECSLSNEFTSIDIDNRYDIHLTVNRSFDISLGSYQKLDVKLKYLASVLDKAYTEGAVGGTVDISEDASKVSEKLIYGDVVHESDEN